MILVLHNRLISSEMYSSCVLDYMDQAISLNSGETAEVGYEPKCICSLERVGARAREASVGQV